MRFSEAEGTWILQNELVPRKARTAARRARRRFTKRTPALRDDADSWFTERTVPALELAGASRD
jgi:hypothetical protein